MKRASIIELNKNFDIPESWEEMSDKQVQFVHQQWYELMYHSDFNIFLSRILDCFLFGKTKIKSGAVRRWSPYSKELALTLFDFMFEVTARGYELNYTETINRIPVLRNKRIKGNYAYGPNDLLSNITFEEYEACNMYLNEYAEGEIDSIYRFIACLYRFENEYFDENKIEINSKIFKRYFKNWEFNMIRQFYCNCVKFIQTEDIFYNGNILNFSVLFKKEDSEDDDKQAQKNNLGWLPVLFDFSEKGIFGNLKETKSTNLFDLLAVMLHQYQENKRIKKEYDKINKKHHKH